MSLRLIFAGTPEFAVPALHAALASGDRVIAVLTQPDRPAGRGRGVASSPIKQQALAAGVPVLQPESLRQPSVRRQLAALEPDLLIVVAYGLILTEQVLALPRYGCWNLHASKLPRWRGAAPIQRAILAGDEFTGIDLMQMQTGLDTGPILLSRHTPVQPDDTGGSLHDRLAVLGAELLSEGLARLHDGTLPPARAQSSDGVCYAHKIEKAEAALDCTQSATDLERKVRAFLPTPIAELDVAGERLRVHAAQAVPGVSTVSPGSVLRAGREGIDIACAEGTLRLTRVQRAGGRALSAWDYLNARPELRSRP